MSYTLFISDLHLCHSRPDMTGAFFNFLKEQITPQCDALYILGDFFEYWIGDDDDSEFNRSIIAALKSTTEKVPVYFVHGNRDFLIGEKFAKACNMTLLPEQSIIDLYGKPALIMHGDSLCTMDVEYMKFRRTSRKKWWQTMMLSLPLFVRRHIAKKARQKSQMNQQNVDMQILDVTPYEVLNQLAINNVDLLIHGHTHRPAIHFIEQTEPPSQRIVLGDWYTQGSYLVSSATGNELKTLPLAKTAT